jgi:beta-lactam-binding protein with PASTA domain
VPKLKSEKLAPAKKALHTAGCKAGKVTVKHGAGHPAKVVAQAPASGKVRPAGTKVELVLH